MDDIPIGTLFGVLFFLILVSAFFSAAEISLVTLNRYRLRHQAESGNRGARLAAKLLERPDRLIGVILLGSNSINALFSALTTVTVIRVWGEKDSAIGIATVIIALVVLILTDLAPKTFAALHPERIAYPSAYVLRPLLKLSYPIVWFINIIANGLLRLLGVKARARAADKLSTEEFKTLVMEAGALMPESHQDMLLAILDLENITVEDVMVPRGEIEGIDLDTDWDNILAQLSTSRYTRVPVYHGNLDKIVGIVHLRKVLHLMRNDNFDRAELMKILVEPYFVPEATPLSAQLLNFRAVKRRVALVVNEYGDIVGLVTLEEILEEIVGDFTSPVPGVLDDVQTQGDGSFVVNGSTHIRDLNRRLDWKLPTSGPKTLNGLIIEYLEDIPEVGTSLILEGYLVEILRTRGTAVQTVRIRPKPETSDKQDPAVADEP